MRLKSVFSACTALIAIVLVVCSSLNDHALSSRPKTLPQLVQATMAAYFSPGSQQLSYKALAKSVNHDLTLQQPAGVFVTLSRQGKPRACWGSVFPQHRNIGEATIQATLGALSQEYRYPPIRKGEVKWLKPQVTVIRRLEPVRSVAGINPLKDGLMVRAGSKSGVILPGEAKDATYQLVLAKLKAGIKPNQSYQLYRIKADVYQ